MTRWDLPPSQRPPGDPAPPSQESPWFTDGQLAAIRAVASATGVSPSQLATMLAAAHDTDTEREDYIPGRLSPASLTALLAAIHDTDPERETFAPARLSAPTLAAAFDPFGVGNGASRALSSVVATMRRGHRSVCVGLVGDSTGDGYLVGAPGTQVDEWPQVLIKQLAAAYPAYTVREKRWNDTNQGYDPSITWQTGTGNGGGERRALFTKTVPGALQYNGTAITTGIDVRAKINPTTWTPTGDQTIAAKWESTGNNRSWLFLLKTTGALGLNWSTAGVSGFGEKDSTATAQSASAFAAGQPFWVRATLTLDNGASGNDVKFYTSPDGVTWTQLGTTITTAGATTLYGGTAPYQMGSFTTGLSSPFDGGIYDVRVMSTIGGQQSVVAPPPDYWDWYSGETTVAFAGAPVLMLLNGSQSGQSVTYFDNATRRVIIHQPHGQSVVMVNTGHNDGTQSRQVWLANYKAMLTNIQGLVPNTPLLCIAQNPAGLGGSFAITQQGIELRATRGAMVQQLAASMGGVYSFDAWPLLAATDTVDQLHPTSGTGSGSEKWGLGLSKRITQPT